MTSNSDTTISNLAYDYGGIHPLASSSSDTTGVDNGTSSVTDSVPSSPPLYSTKEDVTTIFVVGFPDDIQEREFQNMFMFSKGFEAASLKWHCKDQTEEQEISNNLNKKQRIGFARFRSRHEAIDGTQEMNGKVVDWEKGCILKAEMAKKNLHIKRSSVVSTNSASATSVLPSLLHSTKPSSATSPSPMTMLSQKRSCNHIQTDKAPALSTESSGTTYESFSPLPSDLLSPKDYKNHDLFMNTPNSISFGDSLIGSFDDQNDYHPTRRMTTSNNDSDQSTIAQPFNLFSTKPFYSDIDAEPFSYLSDSTPLPHHEFPFASKGSIFSNTEDFMPMGRKDSLKPSSNSMDRSFSISSVTSVRPNPADQNPPCNTLYVGNLPPTTNEDELRSLFARCQGYKRMCFRQKPQGPMCFVEFDDVVFATQAMSDNQGHVLSNSVKGGIRLSFSKNPLFIKPTVNKDANISFNFKQMGTALLADL